MSWRQQIPGLGSAYARNARALWVRGEEPGRRRRMLDGSPQNALRLQGEQGKVVSSPWAAITRCGPCSSGMDPPGASASLRIAGRKQPVGSLLSTGTQGYIAQYISSVQGSITFPPTQDLRHNLTPSAFCKINCSCCVMFHLKATSE